MFLVCILEFRPDIPQFKTEGYEPLCVYCAVTDPEQVPTWEGGYGSGGFPPNSQWFINIDLSVACHLTLSSLNLSMSSRIAAAILDL